MAECFLAKSGGGASLNFKVICNPQPATAKDNTIWVDTDHINKYYFSAEQPENMVDYDVWFPIGTSSTVAFNALKKCGIEVYPISAKQYVGGAWVEVTAKSYQGGAWVDWWDGELYHNGNKYEDYTGGFTGARFTDTGTTIGATGSYYAAGGGGSIYTNKAIDVTEYNTLCVNVSSFSRENSNTAHFGLTSTRAGDFAVRQEITSQGTKYLDISGLSGEYYFLLLISDNYTSSTVTVYFDLIKLMNR